MSSFVPIVPSTPPPLEDKFSYEDDDFGDFTSGHDQDDITGMSSKLASFQKAASGQLNGVPSISNFVDDTVPAELDKKNDFGAFVGKNAPPIPSKNEEEFNTDSVREAIVENRTRSGHYSSQASCSSFASHEGTQNASTSDSWKCIDSDNQNDSSKQITSQRWGYCDDASKKDIYDSPNPFPPPFDERSRSQDEDNDISSVKSEHGSLYRDDDFGDFTSTSFDTRSGGDDDLADFQAFHSKSMDIDDEGVNDKSRSASVDAETTQGNNCVGKANDNEETIDPSNDEQRDSVILQDDFGDLKKPEVSADSSGCCNNSRLVSGDIRSVEIPKVPDNGFGDFSESNTAADDFGDFEYSNAPKNDFEAFKNPNAAAYDLGDFKNSSASADGLGDFKNSNASADDIEDFKNSSATSDGLGVFKNSDTPENEFGDFKNSNDSADDFGDFTMPDTHAGDFRDFKKHDTSVDHFEDVKASEVLADDCGDFKNSDTSTDDFGDFKNSEAPADEPGNSKSSDVEINDLNEFKTPEKLDDEFGKFKNSEGHRKVTNECNSGEIPISDFGEFKNSEPEDNEFGNFKSSDSFGTFKHPESNDNDFGSFQKTEIDDDEFGDFKNSESSKSKFGEFKTSNSTEYEFQDSKNASEDKFRAFTTSNDAKNDFADFKSKSVEGSSSPKEVDQKTRTSAVSSRKGQTGLEVRKEESPSGQDDEFSAFSDTSPDDFGHFEDFQSSEFSDKSPPCYLKDPKSLISGAFSVKEEGEEEGLVELWDIKLLLDEDHSVWGTLCDTGSSGPRALSYQWAQSTTHHLLLGAVGVDLRNILWGQGLPPMFGNQLSLDPLQPTKAISPDFKRKLMVEKEPQEASVPPPQFDWSSSGLVNPLEATLEKELLGNRGDNPESSIPSPLEKLMEQGAKSTLHPARPQNLSPEAVRILDQLPNLNYMRSKVLMFPIK